MCIMDALAYISPTFGEIRTQREEYKAMKYRNEQLLEEAKAANENAARERQEGIEEARTKKLQAILNMGKNTSKMASNNIATSSVSLLNLNKDEKLNAELEALSTLRNYNNRADNYERQADKIYSDYSLGKFNQKRMVRKGVAEVQSKVNQDAMAIATAIMA